MIPDEVALPGEIDLELEKAPPKDPEEALIRYVALLESGKLDTTFKEFPKYHLEITSWRPAGGPRLKLSCHVKSHRALRDEIWALLAVVSDIQEGKV